MVMLNLIKSILIGLFFLVFIGVGFHQWHWLYFVESAVFYFITICTYDTIEAWVINKFNPPDSTFRG